MTRLPVLSIKRTMIYLQRHIYFHSEATPGRIIAFYRKQ